MREQLKEIDPIAIIRAPTFDNTIVALEAPGDFSIAPSARFEPHACDTIRPQKIDRMAPKLAAPMTRFFESEIVRAGQVLTTTR